MAFPPHGACWLWNELLIAMHLIGDGGTAVYYVLIPGFAFYVYRAGRLKRLKAAFPKLWRRGIAFVLFCSLNHFGASAEIWVGGWLYYVTGVNKLFMLCASAFFFAELLRRLEDLVLLGQMLEAAEKEEAWR